MAAIAAHPQRNTIRLQLKQNLILREMPGSAFEELERELEITEYRKGETLVRQGATGMEQFFILDGILPAPRGSPLRRGPPEYCISLRRNRIPPLSLLSPPRPGATKETARIL